MGSSDLLKRRADAGRRAERAFMARVGGATWAQAADIAGYANEANARRAVRKVFEQMPAPDREHARTMLRERNEVVFRQALRDVLERRPGAVVAAVRVLDLMARLDGLHAPAQMEVGISPTAEEMSEFITAVLALRSGRDLPEEADIFGDAEVLELEEGA